MRRTWGFTLVELLVVMAILAILTSLLFPVFRNAKDRADRESCANNLRVIAQAVMAYHQDHLVYPPPAGFTGLRGIPEGGIPALQFATPTLSRNDLWCSRDTYPDRLPSSYTPKPARDGTDSTYDLGFNYYGYVTTTDGTPFPVTTAEAAHYLFGDPKDMDGTLADDSPLRGWNLKLVNARDFVIGPAKVTLLLNGGQTQQFTSSIADVTWTATGGTIDANGLYTAGGVEGDYKVTAVHDDVAVSATVTISSAGSLVISPGLVVATLGQPVSFAATPSAGVTWSAKGGKVDANGVLTEGMSGAVITATSPAGTASATVVYISPAGLFPGLWNTRAPADTPVSYCTFHDRGRGHPIVQVVTLAGSALAIDPVKPRSSSSGAAERKPALDGSNAFPAIDWRINRAPFPMGGKQESSLFGDSEGNSGATTMPIVETTYRQFTAREVEVQTAVAPAVAYGFYDTGIALQPGDLVMVAAHARWAWGPNTRVAVDAGSPMSVNKAAYQTLYDANDELWCTAEGDPVEAKIPRAQLLTRYASMLAPGYQHNSLVGYLGDPAQVVAVADLAKPQAFFLGSRGSHLVTAADLPAGATSTTLLLSLNDTVSQSAYTDNLGWCEAWIAIIHPQAAQ
jgi:prepilin-type N-terminal cleavage/methylation domain-containing protein